MSKDHDPASALFARTSEDAPSPGAMLATDPLSDVLRAVRLNAATFFLIDATQPYCVDIPHTDHYRSVLQPMARHMMSFHVIVEGDGVAAVAGGAHQRYSAGDIVIFPRGDGYRMATAEDTPPEFDYDQTMGFFHGLAAGTLPFVIAEGGGRPPPTRVICGFLGCDAGPFNPLLASLDPQVIVRRPDDAPLLNHLIELTLREAQRDMAGGASVRLGLAELMFIEAIRHSIASSGDTGGWLGGLGDAIVGRALTRLHGQPRHAWTLEALAAETGTSRSTLAERFQRYCGCGPMQYLANWRMQLAARQLADTQDTVGRIAFQVGYNSEPAFSRAFKRITGTSPAAWRRAHRSPAD